MLVALELSSKQHPEHRLLEGTKDNASYSFRVADVWNTYEHILGTTQTDYNNMTILHHLHCSSDSLSSESFPSHWLKCSRILTQYEDTTSNTASKPAAGFQDFQSIEKHSSISSPGSLQW